MIKRLLRLVLGYSVLCVPAKFASLVINLLREKNIASWGYSMADGGFRFCTTRRGYLYLKEKIGAPTLVVLDQKGASFFLYRRRKHVGLLCGALLAVLLFLASFSVLWDVRIEGNEVQSDQQITAILKDAGLEIGRRIRDLDTKEIANRAVLSDARLSFVGVNLRGCVAYVTVRETQDGREEENTSAPADLVAACDGLIESLSVECGKILVRAGQVVRAGERLVSGVRNGLNGDTPVRAEGAVYARVNRTLSIAIPRVVEQKRPQKAEIREISLLFWGKSVNIYRNSGNLPFEYDTIYRGDFFYAQGDVRLPFGYLCVSVLPYEKESRTLNETEQITLALSCLQEEIGRVLQGGELLKKSVRGVFADGVYTVTCELECIMDIAVAQEITTGSYGGTNGRETGVGGF